MILILPLLILGAIIACFMINLWLGILVVCAAGIWLILDYYQLL